MQTLQNSIETAFEGLTGVAFVSIAGYKDAQNGEQNALINVGVSYENAKLADITFLQGLSFADNELLEQARLELIESLIKPSQSRSEGQIEAYTHLCNGVKQHKESKALYIFGFSVKKTVISEGETKTDTRKPLTKAKDHLRSQMKSTKFRLYKVEKISSVKVMGQTIEIGV